MDANVVLFTPPEELFTLQSCAAAPAAPARTHGRVCSPHPSSLAPRYPCASPRTAPDELPHSSPPEHTPPFRPRYVSTGTQVFQDYLRSFRTVDPWLVHSYIAEGGYSTAGRAPAGGAPRGPGGGSGCADVGVSPLAWYEAVTAGAEIDSSVVLLDKRRGWRLLHAVCGLNWYRHVVYRWVAPPPRVSQAELTLGSRRIGMIRPRWEAGPAVGLAPLFPHSGTLSTSHSFPSAHTDAPTPLPLPGRHMWGDKDTWALGAVMLASADAATGSGPSATGPSPSDSQPPASARTDSLSPNSDAEQSAVGAGPVAADPARLCPTVGAAAFASVAGSHVGWFLNRAVQPPVALWGHVQFARGSGVAPQPSGAGSGGGARRAGGSAGLAAGVAAAGISAVTGSGSDPPTDIDTSHDASRLLYLNWQPHYLEVSHNCLAPATSQQSPLCTHASALPPSSLPLNPTPQGYFDLGPSSLPAAAGASLDCCVMLDDLWEGPHDSPTKAPRAVSAAYTRAVRGTLNDTRVEMLRMGMGLPRPRWLGQPRFRRCAIYWALLAAATVILLVRAAALAGLRRAQQRTAASVRLHAGHGQGRRECCSW